MFSLQWTIKHFHTKTDADPLWSKGHYSQDYQNFEVINCQTKRHLMTSQKFAGFLQQVDTQLALFMIKSQSVFLDAATSYVYSGLPKHYPRLSVLSSYSYVVFHCRATHRIKGHTVLFKLTPFDNIRLNLLFVP